MGHEMDVDPRKIEQLDDEVSNLTITVSKLSVGQASTNASIERLADAFKDTSRDVREEIRLLARDSAPKPVSWSNWLMVLFALLAFLASLMFGVQTYVQLQMAPVRESVELVMEHARRNLERLFEQSYDQGVAAARLDHAIEHGEKIHANESELAELRAIVLDNKERISDVDQIGGQHDAR